MSKETSTSNTNSKKKIQLVINDSLNDDLDSSIDQETSVSVSTTSTSSVSNDNSGKSKQKLTTTTTTTTATANKTITKAQPNLSASKKQSLEALRKEQLARKQNKEAANKQAAEALANAALLSAQQTLQQKLQTLEEKNLQFAIELEKCRELVRLKENRIFEIDQENFNLRDYLNQVEQQLVRMKDYADDLQSQLEQYEAQELEREQQKSQLNNDETKTKLNQTELDYDTLDESVDIIKQFENVSTNLETDFNKRIAQLSKLFKVACRFKSRPSISQSRPSLSNSSFRQQSSIQASNSRRQSSLCSSRSSIEQGASLSPETLRLLSQSSIKNMQKMNERSESITKTLNELAKRQELAEKLSQQQESIVEEDDADDKDQEENEDEEEEEEEEGEVDDQDEEEDNELDEEEDNELDENLVEDNCEEVEDNNGEEDEEANEEGGTESEIYQDEVEDNPLDHVETQITPVSSLGLCPIVEDNESYQHDENYDTALAAAEESDQQLIVSDSVYLEVSVSKNVTFQESPATNDSCKNQSNEQQTVRPKSILKALKNSDSNECEPLIEPQLQHQIQQQQQLQQQSVRNRKSSVGVSRDRRRSKVFSLGGDENTQPPLGVSLITSTNEIVEDKVSSVLANNIQKEDTTKPSIIQVNNVDGSASLARTKSIFKTKQNRLDQANDSQTNLNDIAKQQNEDVANYLGELNENPGSKAEKPPASAKKSKTIEKKVPAVPAKKTNENHPQAAAAKPPIPLPKKLPAPSNHESSNQHANKQECKVLKQVTNISQQQLQSNNDSIRKMPVSTNDESECEFDTVNSSTNNLTDSQSFGNNSCNSSSSSGHDSANNENNNASGRRAKKQVSYKEIPLNTKMRRDSENKICIKEKRNSQQMKIEGVDNDNSNN